MHNHSLKYWYSIEGHLVRLSIAMTAVLKHSIFEALKLSIFNHTQHLIH